MKRVLVWIAGVVVGGLLLLAVIGYLSGPQKPSAERAEAETTNNRLTELKSTLEAHNLDLCDTYHWIENMEKETRLLVETNQPKASATEKNESIEFMRDQEWMGYCKKHRIPDSVRTEINIYGMSECK